MSARRIVASLRGLPEWLIRDYLAALGAQPDAAEPDAPHMRAGSWSATWSSERIAVAGSALALTQFAVVIEGDDDVVPRVFDEFMKKAQRGGG